MDKDNGNAISPELTIEKAEEHKETLMKPSLFGSTDTLYEVHVQQTHQSSAQNHSARLDNISETTKLQMIDTPKVIETKPDNSVNALETPHTDSSRNAFAIHETLKAKRIHSSPSVSKHNPESTPTFGDTTQSNPSFRETPKDSQTPKSHHQFQSPQQMLERLNIKARQATLSKITESPHVDPLQYSIIRTIVDEVMQEYQAQIKGDIHNMHLELIRQFQFQKVKFSLI